MYDGTVAPGRGDSLKTWQFRIFWLLWSAYASYYLCRVNFAVAQPAILLEFPSWTAARIGLIPSVYAAFYAIGQVINGALGERLGARRMMTAAMIIAAATNIAFGMTSSYAVMLTLWAVNGFAQGLRTQPVQIPNRLPDWLPGFVDFCRRHAEECGARTAQPQSTPLTAARLAELARVQTAVNRDVAYRPDSYTFGKSDFWEFPFVYGDCEDIALKKRRELVRLGWPRENLLLALVGLPQGGLHMVLVVVTDRGELVLDNLHRQVTVAARLDYRWLSRQSRRDESAWVTVAGGTGTPSR